MTQEELTALCAEWQKRLRLMDWTIKIRFAKFHDLTPDCSGDVNWVLKKKQALIKILSPEDYDPSLIVEQDAEITIVHELLHLSLAGAGPHTCNDGTLSDVVEEQAVHALSCALVELKREAGK